MYLAKRFSCILLVYLVSDCVSEMEIHISVYYREDISLPLFRGMSLPRLLVTVFHVVMKVMYIITNLGFVSCWHKNELLKSNNNKVLNLHFLLHRCT